MPIAPLFVDQAGFGEVAGRLAELGLRYRGNLEQAYRADGSVLYLRALFSRPEGEVGSGSEAPSGGGGTRT